MTRKGMTFGKSLVVGVLVSATLIGCGSDDDGDAGSGGDGGLSTSEIAAILVESGAPQDEADCVAESFEGEYSREDLQAFVDSEDGQGVDAELLAEIAAALPECIG